MKKVDPPLFSVIIPTHNRADLLRIATQSVIDQLHKNWELIIVDDGSNDDTKAVVNTFRQSDDRIKYIFQPHQERSTARNRGIKEAAGKYICFLDDDDYYLDHHLSSFFDWLEAHKFPEIILRTGFYTKEDGKLTATEHYKEERDINPVRFAAFKFCSACTLCVPKQFLERDQFPASFRHWQDTHLILRLFSKFPLVQLPIFSYIYVVHPKMGSKTIYQFPDALQRIENNINAIRDIFDQYGSRVNSFLPTWTRDYLICQKYLSHSHGALKSGNSALMWQLLKNSLQHNKRMWFVKGYIKVCSKMTLLFFQKQFSTFLAHLSNRY